MSKKTGFVLLSVISGILFGGAFAGNKLYDYAIKPRQRTDEDPDSSELVTRGRRWVRNHESKRDIYISSIDSLRLHASYIPGNDGEHHYVVLIHGIWDSSEGMGIYAQEYAGKGWNILLPDLRGFGQSEGDYIGYGHDDRYDIIEWIYWIIKRDKDARILLHGTSMGAATTLLVTGESLPENVVCAISDSSYTSVKDEFEEVYEGLDKKIAAIPRWIAIPLLRFEVKVRAGYDIYKIRPIDAVKNSKTPTLFLHGDADEFVKPHMCRELFDAAACKKEFCMTLGAKHIEGVWIDSKKYWKKVDDFLSHNNF
jgi:fermentation-respiration switch protein FrsA (DUF1100 family)